MPRQSRLSGQFPLLITLLASLMSLESAPSRADGQPPTLQPIPIEEVRITNDPFWSPKREIWQRITINDCFDKFQHDGAFKNFDLVRDGKGGRHGGPQWYDGLVYEMITGASDFLLEHPDAALQQRIEGYIGRIAAAADKDPDGYINTHTQLVEPNHRWGQNGGNDRDQHDLYNAGCLLEAGVHYYRATGQTELLRVATRLANYMCEVMGPGRKNIIPGHAIGEASFIELYHLFRDQPDLKHKFPFPIDEQRYLALAKFWIDNRGNHEGRQSFGAYDQDDKPVLQQETIEGHAVRATLLATGLTELASTTRQDDYRAAAKRLWENMTSRRMYITGGVGAVANDEKFGGDYVLPNNGYLETCASVGAAFFHQRMNLDTGQARYADELERVLYNGVLGGVSLSGNRYFYENPPEAGKNRVRWPWHACPCCPPMFLKLMGAFPGYIYAKSADAFYVNLYASSDVQTKLADSSIALRQTTRYPWAGDVQLTIQSQTPATFDLNLRVPGWCQSRADPNELYSPQGRPEEGAFVVKVNGEPASLRMVNGYASLHRAWQKGDVIDIRMQMDPRRVTALPAVAATAGKVALTLGPIVYCMESIDNDGRVTNVSLPDEAELKAEFRADLMGGVTVIHAAGMQSFAGQTAKPFELTAIPYYANANRAAASRRVWIVRNPADATPGALADIATPSASHLNPSDSLAALNDAVLPKTSDDESIPRFTWWDHRGTTEWVQYTFEHPTRLTAASVYWWDERRIKRHCRVPASWRLVYLTADKEWKPVPNPSGYSTDMDKGNRVTFDPIETTALRIEAQLQPQWSGGILEWTLEQPAR